MSGSLGMTPWKLLTRSERNGVHLCPNRLWIVRVRCAGSKSNFGNGFVPRNELLFIFCCYGGLWPPLRTFGVESCLSKRSLGEIEKGFTLRNGIYWVMTVGFQSFRKCHAGHNQRNRRYQEDDDNKNSERVKSLFSLSLGIHFFVVRKRDRWKRSVLGIIWFFYTKIWKYTLEVILPEWPGIKKNLTGNRKYGRRCDKTRSNYFAQIFMIGTLKCDGKTQYTLYFKASWVLSTVRWNVGII